MAAGFSKGPWRVAFKTTESGRRLIEVRNTRRDPIAVVYTHEADARLMANAANLLGSLKHTVAILSGFERDGLLTVSGVTALNRARELIADVTA